MKMWDGRFKTATDDAMERFNCSLGFDKIMAEEDISGSIAYSKALKKVGVLSAKEQTTIEKGLITILKEIETDKAKFLPSDEDIHMAVERLLTEKIGSVGGKLHTGRSRNSQVALDSRMFVKKASVEVSLLIKGLMKSILSLAKKQKKTVMTGYTHLQPAQPILFSHYIMALFHQLNRDFKRFSNAYENADIMPLGSGAIAGSAFPLDRKMLARELKFKNISENSMDAVSDRDFIFEFISASSMLITHLSRYAEDLIIYSSKEFSFVELSDAFSTGSSMMPNKKNPDSLELIRGKSARIFGNLTTILTCLKGAPLTYAKDIQEDKEPLFDSLNTIRDVLVVFTGVISTITINKDKMKQAMPDEILATDLADILVRNGVPFREAHGVSGKIVAYSLENDIKLTELSDNDLRKFSKDFPANTRISVENALSLRNIYGGTGPKALEQQLKKATETLKKLKI